MLEIHPAGVIVEGSRCCDEFMSKTGLTSAGFYGFGDDEDLQQGTGCYPWTD